MIFPEKSPLGNIFLLIALNLLVISGGYILLQAINMSELFKDLIILTILFFIISGTTVIVFFRGLSREPQIQVMHTLVSLSVKFLLEMVLALVWFIVAKKTSAESVFLFFVLYLTSSLFSIYIILKALKNKSL